MNKSEALKFFQLKDGTVTKSEFKKIYRKLSILHHPDKGGNEETFKILQAAYELLQMQYRFTNDGQKKDAYQQSFENDPQYWKCFGDKMEAAYKAIFTLKGIVIEVCGIWLWVSGNTYEYRQTLKEAGYLFSSKKKMWYWREYDSGWHKGSMSIDQIRAAYGSIVLEKEEREEIQS